MNRFNSVKLIPHDSIDLDRLSYSNGDLVFDVTLGTIRLMDGSTLGGSKLATQGWVNSNTITTASLTTTLNSYVTTTAQTTALSSYATTASLSSYATTASLSSYATTASLSSYATTASLSSYATTANLALKANLASPTFTGTVTAPTAIIGGVNIKPFSIAMAAALA